MKPLEGIRVIDLSTYVAAPSCGKLLADMGAEVIKIESPKGDGWRLTSMTYKPRFNAQENPIFDIYNTGKKMISVNLKSDEGQEVFHKLLASADIFITNNREAALKKLKCSYDDLKDRFPRLIYGWVSGYGSNGPDAELPAFDTTAFWPRTGFLMDQALKDENGGFQPVTPPSGVGDSVTGYILLSELIAALYQREKTGKGQFVESNLYNVGLYTMGAMIVWKQGMSPESKMRSETGALTGTYRCKDGEYLYIPGAMVERLPYDLSAVLGCPERGDEFKRDRWTRAAELYQVVSGLFLTQDSSYWLQRAREVGLPMAKLLHYCDVVNDEQAWANGFLEEVEFESGNTNIVPVSPIHMETIDGLRTVPVAPVGTDTKAVLKDLGYTDEEIQVLNENGSVTCYKKEN